MADSYLSFITSTHELYERYYRDWKLCLNSYYGGTEYKNGKYLRAYQSDFNTPGQTIATYEMNDTGAVVAKYNARVEIGTTAKQTDRGQDILAGGFYLEKLENTPLYNYVKLIVSEYNAILFRNPPQRYVGDSPEAFEFMNDVDGEGNSVSEFMSQVDILSTVFGVVHVTCVKPLGSDIPKWRVYTPLDVTNWEYSYDIDGNLKLRKVVLKIESNDYHSVYRMMTPNTMETIFVGADDDYYPPVEDERMERIDEKSFRVVQENELGYIPLKTFYQSQKVYNNVGTTVIQDVAQIQRSIYGDMAEVYAAITYGAHPTLVVDETTSTINGGDVGAEPGSVIKVQSSLTGDQNYTYEFKTPPLDAITEIRELVDNKVQKLSQIAMLRSEDLIRAANSGAQIEVFDDKLSALIRRKATNLENGEAKLWDIWYDWLNMPKPEDFSISYNRQYNRRALEIEIKELDMLMGALERYDTLLKDEDEEEEYKSKEPEVLPNIPGRTYADGEPIPVTLPALYVPSGSTNVPEGQMCLNCEYYAGGMCGKFQAPVREDYWCKKWESLEEELEEEAMEDAVEEPLDIAEDQEEAEYEQFKIEFRAKIRGRLEQLLNSSTTDNGF